MNAWIRLYREALHDPKIVSLTDRQHRAWINCLMMADDDGFLPAMRDVACHMRSTTAEAEHLITDLVEVGLIDPEVMTIGQAKFRLHGWQRRQYKSDTSTKRVRKFRDKAEGNGDETFPKRRRNVTVTPPEPDTDTDTEPEVQSRARAKAGSDIGNVTGSEVPEVEPELLRRAEGLGLNAKALEGECYGPKVKNPSAYFQSLCRKRLRQLAPGISDAVIGRGLCGDKKAFADLMNIILLADNAR